MLSWLRIFATSRLYLMIYFMLSIVLIVFENKIKEMINDNKIVVILRVIMIIMFIYSILSLTINNGFVYAGF